MDYGVPTVKARPSIVTKMMRNQDQGFIDPALAGCGDAASIPLSSDEPHLVNEQLSRVSLKSGYDGYDIARRTWSVTLF